MSFSTKFQFKVLELIEFLVPSDFWIRREVGQRKKKEKVPQRPVFDIHQAKHEVRKLAISTMRKAGKQEARAALAISLGAIAPKAKAVHYKEVRSVALVLLPSLGSVPV